jgi:uncharacterized DUF497 family protein
MPFVQVEDLSFDEVNLDKFAEHGVSARQVRQLLDDPFLVLPNRRNRRAPYLLLGRDHGGACLAVPIEPTGDPEVWRPVTAWLCKESERAILTRHGL